MRVAWEAKSPKQPKERGENIPPATSVAEANIPASETAKLKYLHPIAEEMNILCWGKGKNKKIVTEEAAKTATKQAPAGVNN